MSDLSPESYRGDLKSSKNSKIDLWKYLGSNLRPPANSAGCYANSAIFPFLGNKKARHCGRAFNRYYVCINSHHTSPGGYSFSITKRTCFSLLSKQGDIMLLCNCLLFIFSHKKKPGLYCPGSFILFRFYLLNKPIFSFPDFSLFITIE